MKRCQLFEFTDMPWCRGIFRKLLTELMQSIIDWLQPYNLKLDLMVNVLAASGTANIVDVCSGSGGPWRHLYKQLEERMGYSLNVRLTDKYPEKDLATKISCLKNITYYPYSVDAMAIPEELKGVMSLFNGLHHFRPEQAKAILCNAVDQHRGIIIMESLIRNARSIITAFASLLIVFFITPFVKPFRLSRYLLTYIIPIAPLLITWDALVSVLRCYTPEELLSFATSADSSQEYEWNAGSYQYMGFGNTYLIGYPKAI